MVKGKPLTVIIDPGPGQSQPTVHCLELPRAGGFTALTAILSLNQLSKPHSMFDKICGFTWTGTGISCSRQETLSCQFPCVFCAAAGAAAACEL